MSEPFKEYGTDEKSRLLGAINELISAQSYLNMEPHPINPPPKQDYPFNAFLSNTDFWVNHSMVHIHEAINLIKEVLNKEGKK